MVHSMWPKFYKCQAPNSLCPTLASEARNPDLRCQQRPLICSRQKTAAWSRQWWLFYPGLIHISRIARLCAGWVMDGFPYIKRGIGGFSFDGARWDVSLFRTAQKEILSSEIISSGDHTPFITFVHKKSVSSLKACFPFTLSVYDEPIKCERRKGILKRVRWLLWGRREGEEE